MVSFISEITVSFNLYVPIYMKKLHNKSIDTIILKHDFVINGGRKRIKQDQMLVNLELHNKFLTLFTLHYFVIFITSHIRATDWRLRLTKGEAVTGLILYCPCLNNLFKSPIKLPYVTLFRFYFSRKWSWGPHVESVKIMLRQ